MLRELTANMNNSDKLRERLSQRLKENPVIVEDTDEGFNIRMESDIYECIMGKRRHFCMLRRCGKSGIHTYDQSKEENSVTW